MTSSLVTFVASLSKERGLISAAQAASVPP